MKTVYVDVLLGLNMFVDFFILLATSKITHTKTRFLRLVIGSLVSAASSMVIFLPELHWIFSLLIRLGISAVTVLCAFKFESIKRLFGRLLAFYSVSFGYAGIITGIWYLFKPDGMIINNGVVYYNISPLLLLASTVAAYCILTVLKKYFGPDRKKDKIYNMEICIDNQSVILNGFLDTGNQLCDMFTDAPVIIVQYDVIKNILPVNCRELFTGNFDSEFPQNTQMQERFRLIPYSVIGGKGVLPAVKTDCVTVNNGRNKMSTYNCVVAVTGENFNEDYSAIFGENLFSYSNERKTKRNDKTNSECL